MKGTLIWLKGLDSMHVDRKKLSRAGDNVDTINSKYWYAVELCFASNMQTTLICALEIQRGRNWNWRNRAHQSIANTIFNKNIRIWNYHDLKFTLTNTSLYIIIQSWNRLHQQLYCTHLSTTQIQCKQTCNLEYIEHTPKRYIQTKHTSSAQAEERENGRKK